MKSFLITYSYSNVEPSSIPGCRDEERQIFTDVVEGDSYIHATQKFKKTRNTATVLDVRQLQGAEGDPVYLVLDQPERPNKGKTITVDDQLEYCLGTLIGIVMHTHSFEPGSEKEARQLARNSQAYKKARIILKSIITAQQQALIEEIENGLPEKHAGYMHGEYSRGRNEAINQVTGLLEAIGKDLS